MTKYLKNISIALLLMVCQSVFSGNTSLFSVSASGTPADISFQLALCLDHIV